MARPIQNTPTIKVRMLKDLEKNFWNLLPRSFTPEEKAAKKKEIREMEESYNLLVSISGGTFY